MCMNIIDHIHSNSHPREEYGGPLVLQIYSSSCLAIFQYELPTDYLVPMLGEPPNQPVEKDLSYITISFIFDARDYLLDYLWRVDKFKMEGNLKSMCISEVDWLLSKYLSW